MNYFTILVLLLVGCRTTAPTAGLSSEDGRNKDIARSFMLNAHTKPVEDYLSKLAAQKDERVQTFGDEIIKYQSPLSEDETIICDRSADGQDLPCQITTRAWPMLGSELCRLMISSYGVAAAREIIMTATKQGGNLRLATGKETPECEMTGVFARYKYSWQRPNVNLARKPKPYANKGLAPSEINTWLANYRLSEADAKTYTTTLGPTSLRTLNERLQTLKKNLSLREHTKNCSHEELLALIDYTRGRYRTMNHALRAIDTRKQSIATLPPDVKVFIRATAAGLNCFKPTSDEIVHRGADLKDDALRPYRVGTIVTEPFLSTSLTGIPATFSGNTEFRIWYPVGADLSSLSEEREENELLIPAGRQFKVTYNEVEDDGIRIIEMQQLD